MRRYECIVIFQPNMSEEEIAREKSRLSDYLEDKGGQDLHVEDWGKRDMAFEMNKHSRGVYVVFYFATENYQMIGELTQTLRLSEKILKFQTHIIDRSIQKPEVEASA